MSPIAIGSFLCLMRKILHHSELKIVQSLLQRHSTGQLFPWFKNGANLKTWFSAPAKAGVRGKNLGRQTMICLRSFPPCRVDYLQNRHRFATPKSFCKKGVNRGSEKHRGSVHSAHGNHVQVPTSVVVVTAKPRVSHNKVSLFSVKDIPNLSDEVI